MPSSRLTTALDEGILTLPDGDVAVLRPPAGYDLSALPQEALRISHGFRPDADYWTAAGFAVTPEPTPAAVALVVVPRSKALARAMIAQASTLAPVVLVDGQKTDGVDSLFRESRNRLGDLPSITKAHGRLFWFTPPADAFSDWAAMPPVPGPEGFFTQAGVFSEGVVDRGSALLAAALPRKLPARVADLGAGWGYLAHAVLARDGVVSLDLIEAERLALDCARLNVTDPRVRFHWADAGRYAPEKAFDAVVMNPPFHVGRTPDPSVGRGFIEAAARVLAAHGQLWVVANRHLPYEATLRERFRNVDEAGGDAAFKVFHATRPKR
jgi:16S rRNA (guanine1207-N2)-methyltransferase